MKNLLNNLLNWVLKNGSSETKKDQAWEEKEQAGSKKDQVKRTKLREKEQAGSKKEQAEQKGNKLGEKGTSLEMNPCGMGSEAREVRGNEAREVMGSEAMSAKGSEAMSANHALITQLSRNNHPISLRAIRYAAVLFMVLMVGIGNVWGDTSYYMFTPTKGSEPAHTGTFSGDFLGNSSSSSSTTRTINSSSMSVGYKLSAVTNLSGTYYGNKYTAYDIKTTQTTFTIYYYNNASADKVIYYALVEEGATSAPTPVKICDATKSSTGYQEFTVNTTTNAKIAFYSTDNSNMYVYQLVAVEKGTAHKKAGEAGYEIAFKSVIPRYTNNGSAKSGSIDGLEFTTLTNDFKHTVSSSTWASSTIGVKVKTSGTNYLKFRNLTADSVKVEVCSSKTYYIGTANNTTSNSSTSTQTVALTHNQDYYIVPGGNEVEITKISFKAASAAPSCTAPNHVDISGDWDKFGGETISLTATAYSSAGTGSPIADGNITGWQWQKLVGSTWTNMTNGTADGVTTSGATTKNLQISNCGQGNSGKYRCVVSTGATCSTASATATDGSEGYVVKVYALECYTDGTTVYNFTRDGNNQRGSVSIALNASTGYAFKIHADKYYGNNGTINFDENNWTFTAAGNNVTVNSGLGGTFTFTIDYSSNGDVPVLAVTYPRKRIYLEPNSDWLSNSAKFAYYYFHKTGDDTDADGWTDFLTADDCGRYADIPQWNGVQMIAVRFNPSDATPGWNGDGHVWNQTSDLTVTSNDLITITGWNNNQTYNSTYSTPTYTISYNKGTNGTGSKANETKTCGVAFTLPGSTFTYAGHTQDGWATTDGGTIAYALSGSYTTNDDEEFFPHWKCNTPTITDNGDNTVTITVPAGTTVSYTTDGSTPTSSTGTVYSSAFTIDATVTVKAIAYQSGCTDSEVVSQACTYHAPAASLTAISADVLYQAADMANITFTGSDQYWAGLSTNNLFQTYGNGTSNSAKGKTISSTNVTDDISTKSFTSHAFVEGSDVTSGTADPTYGAIEFITPSTAGLLYVYTVDGSSSNLKLRKKGSSTFTALTGSSNYNAIAVDANSNYYIHGNTGKRGLYGIQYVSTYAVSITPTNVTKATGATGAGAAIKGKAYTATFTAPVGYTLPSDVTSLTIGGTPQTKGSGYTWTISAGTATLTVPADKVTGAISIAVSGVAATTYDVDFSLTNVAYSSGDNEGTDAATEGVEFSTIFAASSGYSLPGTITVTIGGVEQTVGTGYTWAQGSGTLTIPAAYVTGDIVVTIVGEEMEGDGCDELVHTEAATATTLTTTVGSATLTNPSGQTANDKAIKLNSSGYIELSPKAGKSFAAGDSLIIVMWNQASSAKTTGYRIAGTDYTASMPSKVNTTFRRKLIAADIVSSKVKIERESDNGSNAYFVSAIIKHCEDLPSCTTPTLPTLSNQTVCPGSDIAAWNAEPTNIATITGASEDVAYSWKKKGSDTELAATASFDLGSSATEGMAGTYVVTVTVSKTGYISKSASAEVDLTVTPTTEEPSVTQSPAKVYTSGSVTLTATCGSEGTKTWQWYTCTNAAGDGESILSGKNSAEYAFTAPASAGTYYYKVEVTGDGTNACGTASHVYALSVNAATGGDCTTYYWFANADDATTNSVTQNESSFFSGAKSGTNNNSTTITVDETELTITKRIGASAETVTFTVPSEKTATLYVNAKANSSSKPLILVRTATSDTIVVTTSTTLANYSAENITAGAWKLTCGSGNNWYYGAIIVKVCGAGSCTDAEPVATATNTTVCSGTALTITATGYETSPTTIQWQKKNGSSWDNISGATTATYTVASAAAEHAGTYRVQVTKGCTRNSNEVTITVPSAPVFGDVPSTVSVMQTQALSITTVEATGAVSYKWYKSANAIWDAGDAEIGSSKELMKAYADEAIGSPSYYVFCRATNSCATTTSSAIAVNVTAYVDADCAIAGSSGEHNTFSKTGSVSSGTYGSITELHTNSNNKYLQYVAEDGYYFKTAKVNACVNDASSLPTAAYSYSTDGGANWTDAALPTAMTTAYADHVIDPLPANVNAFRVGRKLGDYGSGSGTLYIHEVCFEYSESCTSTTVTASPTSKTHTIGDSFTKPTFTVKHGETTFDPQPSLTYTSSNEDIATVDDDGTVNFQGMTGTVTITASFAGGTISATEYCASSGSYTITVSCSSERPKIVPGGTVNMSGCNPSVALDAKMQDGTSDFSPAGTYQWYRDGEAISGATSASYTARQAGIYTVERTYDGCTNVSSNNATITSERVEPEIKHLVPFQYYHVDSIYHETSIMRYRHLFTVKASEEYNSTGRNFKMELSKNGSTPEDKTTSNAFVVKKSADNTVDTVLIDLNKLSGKFAEGDELIFTCKAVDCAHNVSEVYKDSITMHVIDKTPTMALILAGKDGGTLDEYEAKNLQEQTGSKSWSGEWPLYTEMKKQYIITPLNGYAPFNKLNYEQYDIIFLTDFPKKSKNATAINNLADLCDYRPLFTFKTHMSGLSKWATKGFTEDPEVPKQSRLRLNIVCYAHPMFEELQTPSVKNQMLRDAGDNTQLVYTLLKEGGYEKNGDVKKGIQGFDFSASDNFVTIGLIHYDATAADSVPDNEHVTWTPGSADQTLVAAAERQYNPEARMVMFSLNAGAHSKLTETGQNVVLACLEYLLQDVMITPMADCAYTFDNDEGQGNGKWSVATNWLQEEVPGPYQSVRIIAPATVDCTDAKALEVRLVDNGKITIAKNGVLTVQSTIRRQDGSETLPTEEDDIVIETAADGQGALIFNNDRGDSRATVNLYSKGRKDGNNYQFQYIAMPMGRVPVHPYFEGSDIFTYAYTEAGGWERRGYYTDLYAFEGIGVTTRRATASSYTIKGALTSTEAQTLDMTYENPETADKGYNMFGNSWSAPIQISQLRVGNEDANIQKTVYIYVAGKDPDGGPTTSGDKTEVAGKWLAIPFDASGFEGWTGLKVIPAFQAFEIQTNAAATLSLDYDKMVRGGTTDRNAALRGPQRRSADHEGIELMVLHLNGGKVSNDLFLFEGEQFSEEFDNGWEATYKEDEEIPTQLYSPTVAGKMAVAALPTLEGTQVNFKTDEAGEYTFTFSGAEIGYYLNDIKEQESALIKEGNAYVFTLEDGDDANRFYISRTPLGAPAIVTGIDEVDAEAMKVRKIIHNDQLYIIRGGQLYDATGKVVK